MPYTANIFLVKIDGATVGVVTGMDIALQHEGGTVTHYYGSFTGAIAEGGNRATFRVQRWFMSDSDKDLLFDLFNDKAVFILSGELDAVSASSTSLLGCMANSWKLILGDANAIIGEEISGEATAWATTLA
jgi:hypothetical protein